MARIIQMPRSTSQLAGESIGKGLLGYQQGLMQYQKMEEEKSKNAATAAYMDASVLAQKASVVKSNAGVLKSVTESMEILEKLKIPRDQWPNFIHEDTDGNFTGIDIPGLIGSATGSPVSPIPAGTPRAAVVGASTTTIEWLSTMGPEGAALLKTLSDPSKLIAGAFQSVVVQDVVAEQMERDELGGDIHQMRVDIDAEYKSLKDAEPADRQAIAAGIRHKEEQLNARKMGSVNLISSAFAEQETLMATNRHTAFEEMLREVLENEGRIKADEDPFGARQNSLLVGAAGDVEAQLLEIEQSGLGARDRWLKMAQLENDWNVISGSATQLSILGGALQDLYDQPRYRTILTEDLSGVYYGKGTTPNADLLSALSPPEKGRDGNPLDKGKWAERLTEARSLLTTWNDSIFGRDVEQDKRLETTVRNLGEEMTMRANQSAGFQRGLESGSEDITTTAALLAYASSLPNDMAPKTDAEGAKTGKGVDPNAEPILDPNDSTKVLRDKGAVQFEQTLRWARAELEKKGVHLTVDGFMDAIDEGHKLLADPNFRVKPELWEEAFPGVRQPDHLRPGYAGAAFAAYVPGAHHGGGAETVTAEDGNPVYRHGNPKVSGSVAGRKGNWDFSVEPQELGGYMRHRFVSEDGEEHWFSIEKDLQGGRWEDGPDFAQEIEGLRTLDDADLKTALEKMWGGSPEGVEISKRVYTAIKANQDLDHIKERLQQPLRGGTDPINTWRQISRDLTAATPTTPAGTPFTPVFGAHWTPAKQTEYETKVAADPARAQEIFEEMDTDLLGASASTPVSPDPDPGSPPDMSTWSGPEKARYQALIDSGKTHTEATEILKPIVAKRVSALKTPPDTSDLTPDELVAYEEGVAAGKDPYDYVAELVSLRPRAPGPGMPTVETISAMGGYSSNEINKIRARVRDLTRVPSSRRPNSEYIGDGHMQMDAEGNPEKWVKGTMTKEEVEAKADEKAHLEMMRERPAVPEQPKQPRVPRSQLKDIKGVTEQILNDYKDFRWWFPSRDEAISYADMEGRVRPIRGGSYSAGEVPGFKSEKGVKKWVDSAIEEIETIMSQEFGQTGPQASQTKHRTNRANNPAADGLMKLDSNHRNALMLRGLMREYGAPEVTDPFNTGKDSYTFGYLDYDIEGVFSGILEDGTWTGRVARAAWEIHNEDLAGSR